MNRMNVSCLRLQSYGDICHLPNNFSEKAETYSDTRANMRQKRRRMPNLSHDIHRSLRWFARNQLKCLADSRKMLTFATLTMVINLNWMLMKKKLISKSTKTARMFGSVESFIYLCRWVRDASGPRSPRQHWISSWPRLRRLRDKKLSKEIFISGRVGSWLIWQNWCLLEFW